MTSRPPLWLLLAHADDPATPYVLATLGWMAEEDGVLLEAYLEAPRQGTLFAGSGSTVLGGDHLGALARLCRHFDVSVVRLGPGEVMASATDGLPVLARADTAVALTRQLLQHTDRAPVGCALVGPGGPATGADAVTTYLYPEIRGRRALGLPLTEAAGLAGHLAEHPGTEVVTACLGPAGQAALAPHTTDAAAVEHLDPDAGTDLGLLTTAIAARWRHQARGVAFGDPRAVLAQLPRLLREHRVSLFAPAAQLPPADVAVSAYTESCSPVVEEVAALATELADPVVIGRQTTDGDIFALSRHGVALQITEPERPPFPVLGSVRARWAGAPPVDAEEPDDDQLRRWASEGAVLTSLVWHSGEVAHNEAMLNVADLAADLDVRMGIGVHAERYRTSQQWELIAVARERGGVRGLIEPLLHSGGRGVLAEAVCPPEALAEHCHRALAEIEAVAGPAHVPTGYYAFCDTDLATLAPAAAEVYQAIESAGLGYVVSSARPGRNRVLRRTPGGVVLNQSARSIASGSPFVRVTTVEELEVDVATTRPGWVLAALDAPVVAFDPYLWRHGPRLVALLRWLADADRGRHNVLPSTIARYARVLDDLGQLPPPELSTETRSA